MPSHSVVRTLMAWIATGANGVRIKDTQRCGWLLFLKPPPPYVWYYYTVRSCNRRSGMAMSLPETVLNEPHCACLPAFFKADFMLLHADVFVL